MASWLSIFKLLDTSLTALACALLTSSAYTPDQADTLTSGLLTSGIHALGADRCSSRSYSEHSLVLEVLQHKPSIAEQDKRAQERAGSFQVPPEW